MPGQSDWVAFHQNIANHFAMPLAVPIDSLDYLGDIRKCFVNIERLFELLLGAALLDLQVDTTRYFAPTGISGTSVHRAPSFLSFDVENAARKITPIDFSRALLENAIYSRYIQK
jgi:hypothetical protein